MSDPSARGTIPEASAHAAPPLDRVAGDAEDGVEGVRAGGELRHVGLADEDRAGVADPLDEQVVVVGHGVGEDR
jgi:hypothetical protein